MAKTCSTCRGSGIWNGQRCPMCEGTGKEFDPGLFICYELGPVVLAGNGIANYASTQILDRPFRAMFLTYVSTGKFTVQIFDSRNKRPFSQQQVHVDNMFGTAQAPMPLLTPYEFEKRGSILANLTDISGAGNTIRLGFIGVELEDPDATEQ